ncbi:MAG: DCC1-like thiol-disulfide oxidoreductase family protein [Myxococcota bacterium]|nr:DCC1-like thiol-disulfide oxidoreductase family protein [Myxococcota bacterium]
MTKPAITSHQFSAVRILFGTSLVGYFCWRALSLDGYELLAGQTGLVRQWRVANPLFMPGAFLGCSVVGVGLALGLMLGWKRRFVGLSALVMWLITLGPDLMITDPPTLFVFCAFIAFVLPEPGEPMAVDEPVSFWRVPQRLQRWLLPGLLFAYTCFGWSEIAFMMAAPMADAANSMPRQSWLSFLICGAASFALPCFIFRALRPWCWTLAVCIQLLCVLSLRADGETVLFLVAHFLAFDGRWLRPKRFSDSPCIVYFDGVCGLCNRAVDFIIQEDFERTFMFASIQSKTAQALNSPIINEGQSMVLQVGQTLHYRSDAVLLIAAGMGGGWRLIACLRIVPRPFRDFAYHVVQLNRYRMFGRHATCRLPTEDESHLFLP